MVMASGTNAFAKEMNIRKRIANIYNKREEDFPSLREYNDYLEEVEDMIINLVEGIDVPAIEARIAEYQRENAEQIMNAQARKAEEYAAALAASKGQIQQTGVDLSFGSQAGTSNVPQGQYAPAVAGVTQPRPMGMGPQPIPLGSGHDMMGLEYEDEETMRLRAEKAARAGGWSVEISKKRALEEAFASIWI
ncbi:cyclin-dependent activating kinase assembly factor-related / CDK-activating kinase assembly factor-like protein [Perilla frutescens var. frutescens]|nr:cyclin-dependent activating kinase assembly factor-related / CDK-activating kinase assembly factor-like protein [Perilla frutescens var. frutescens]